MELKEIDKKIIAHLSENARDSFTKIAKDLKLSREQVEYRIKKYYSEDLIKQIPAIINYGIFGYNYLGVLLIKLTDSNLQNKFIEKLSKHKNCFSVGRVFNKYDLFANMIFKDEDDAREKISLLISSKEVLHSTLLKPFFSELYPLKIVDNKEPIKIIPKIEKINFDKKDLKIIKLLSKDARIKIIDIATKLKISAELALHKLKKIYSKNAILGYRIHFNYSQLKKFFSIITIDLKNLSNETIELLKKYARNSELVSSLSLSFSSPNILIQIFHETEEEFRKEIEKLKRLFPELINLDVLFIEGEKEVNVIPFYN